MNAGPALSLSPLWQRLQWVFNPVAYLETAQAQCPDIFLGNSLGFGFTEDDIVIVNHPQAIQQLLTSDRKQFTAPGSMNGILTPLLGSSSVIMIDGDPHRKRRQLVMPSFHGDRLHSYAELIRDVTQQVFANYRPGESFLAREAMQNISLQVIFKSVFGLAEGQKYHRLKQLLGSMADLFRSPLTTSFLFFPQLQKDLGPWSPWGNFIRRRREADQLLYQEIAERRANPDSSRTDILSLLMAAKDEAGEPMTDPELRDELMTLLFAGHETTATAMSWALYWLHAQPDIKAKLLAELDSLGNSPDLMSIIRLPYLNAICNETLRIYPVAMLTFPRQLQEPIEMLGYSLKKGTVVIGCMYLTHQREDLYPHHQEFNPDRFLEKHYSPYEFIPFGGGVRRCLGETLAQFEMKLVLATVISQYQLSLGDKRPEKPQRRGVTLAPARGVKMVMQGKR
jgi:unspecific monooxygenase